MSFAQRFDAALQYFDEIVTAEMIACGVCNRYLDKDEILFNDPEPGNEYLHFITKKDGLDFYDSIEALMLNPHCKTCLNNFLLVDNTGKRKVLARKKKKRSSRWHLKTYIPSKIWGPDEID